MTHLILGTTFMKQMSGTYEWACKTFNVCCGCTHNCKYCYAKSLAIRYKRATAESWKNPIPLPYKLAMAGRGKPTRIMFPSTHDISPECLDICIEALERMLKRGHTVLVVSKPHADCIAAICSRFGNYKDKIIFRFTIGSTNNHVLNSWEPNAPQFEERILCLELAHAEGYQTSVSCEPMLDTAVDKVIAAAIPFVTDSIWLGVMNRIKQQLTLNGASPDNFMMAAKLKQQCSPEMVRDLYERLKDNPKIKWKDSIKDMLGLDKPTMPGMDV